MKVIVKDLNMLSEWYLCKKNRHCVRMDMESGLENHFFNYLFDLSPLMKQLLTKLILRGILFIKNYRASL